MSTASSFSKTARLSMAVLAAALVLVTAGHLWRVSPPAPLPPAPLGELVKSALATTAWNSRQAATTSLREVLQAAGAEVCELPVALVTPRTVAASLHSAAGVALADVAVMPLAPNGLQPCTTPPAGIRGELTLVTSELLATAPSFAGRIAVIDAAAPPKELGLAWDNYADLGFTALLVTHRDGLAAADWAAVHAGMVTPAPLSFPRGAADPSILAHVGETVVLHLRQDLRAEPTTAVVARLRAAAPAREAVVLVANLDEVRALADRAAGPEQRLGRVWLEAAVAMLGADPQARTRDVLVIAAPGAAEAQDGIAQAIATLGPLGAEGASGRESRRDRQAQQRQLSQLLGQARTRLAAGWLTPEQVATGDPAVLAFLGDELAVVLGELVVEAQERCLAAILAAERAAKDPVLQAKIVESKREEARLGVMAGFEPAALISRKSEALATYRVAARLHDRLIARQVEADQVQKKLDQEVVLSAWMADYDRVVALAFAAPGDGQAGWAMPAGTAERRALSELLTGCLDDADAQSGATSATAIRVTRDYETQTTAALAGSPLPTSACSQMGWPAATLISSGSTLRMQRSSWPAAVGPQLAPVSVHAVPALQVVQRLAAGAKFLPQPLHAQVTSVSGRVLAAGVGGAAVPTHPLAGALIVDKPRYPETGTIAGARLSPILASGLDGHYARFDAPAVRGPFRTGWSPATGVLDSTGTLIRHSDESLTVQSLARSLDLGNSTSQLGINLVAFRATPLALLDRVDPRTMRTFAGVEFVRINGLAAPARFARYDAQPGPQCWLLAPEERVAVLLKMGAPDNPLAVSMVAFLLGEQGRGLLVADGPYIDAAQRRIAASLDTVNDQRLPAATAAQLADQRITDFAASSDQLLQRADPTNASAQRDRILAARDAGTYGQIVYGELRGAVSSAVDSIVWYLFLLVPFAFFLERLLFGFADIRRALMTHAVIFMASFGLLGGLHPAFQLVGSPAMILLGFVILLISLAVTGLFLARAKENLASFGRQRGTVAAAQPDLLGILATSMALGINGLSRRQVRTGLTCATLSLITLCLILFVSARANLVETTRANGVAAYQGFVVRGDLGRALPGDELRALRLRYGQDFPVLERATSIGIVNWYLNTWSNPTLDLSRSTGQNVTAHGLLQWPVSDPLLRGLRFNAGSLAAVAVGEPRPVAVSGTMAHALGLQPSDLPATVTLGGIPCQVTGIFEADSLTRLRDLDGRSLLPFDLAAMPRPQRGRDGAVLGMIDDPLIPAGDMILTDDRPLEAPLPNLEMRTTACAVVLDGIPFRTARELIDRRLEQTGQPTHYGLDGVAVTGRNARASALDGLADMLIPLLIAGLTVLNTMRGSVYERRDEIAIYNAVGIAPRFISAMFFAEALVFAVVGSVLGYLAALLLGRSLGWLGWDAGLQVDYASLTPIWASLALAAVVFLSTWFPARAAAEIAAPSDDAGWTVPKPEGDRLAFPLPFAFGARDRIAVLAFFRRVFADHGDGGGGSFHCDNVRLDVMEAAGGPEAAIRCQVWLKPFDLGVAQELELRLVPEAGSGEWLAELALVRRSGTRESWLRLNRPFIAALRQRLLHWRAIDPTTRDELHAEAVGLLRGAHVPA